MLRSVWLALTGAGIFYVLLPVFGAFIVRQRWRRFRANVMHSSALPELGAAPIKTGQYHRFQGAIDAIGDSGELWLSNETFSCVINVHNVWVHTLTRQSNEDTVERCRWKQLTAITSGTRVFAAGIPELERGKLMLNTSGKEESFVVVHDGNDATLIRRLIWAGRQKNEYWNPLTQISIAFGAAAMSIIIPMALPRRMPPIISAFTLAAAFSPVLVLLPPGVLGFFAYRKYWLKARYCRAKRDTVLLDGESERSAGSWNRAAWAATIASAAAFASSLSVNAWLFISVIRRFLL